VITMRADSPVRPEHCYGEGIDLNGETFRIAWNIRHQIWCVYYPALSGDITWEVVDTTGGTTTVYDRTAA
jgi:hypothetical protein